MPEIKVWVIIVLVIFAWAQYTYPDKTKSIGDMTFGKLNEYIKVKGVAKVQDKAGDICPDTLSLVCGSDGITYDNMCKAAIAGVLSTTAGACENE